MASEPDKTEETKEEKGKKPLIIKLVIALVAVSVLGAGGYVGWAKFFKKPEETQEGDKERPKKPVEMSIVPLDAFTVNLMDPGGKRYLKITMQLQVNSKQGADEVAKDSLPKVKDAVLVILSSKESGDIVPAEGKDILKKEILDQINRIIQKGKVTDVYFTEFLIQ